MANNEAGDTATGNLDEPPGFRMVVKVFRRVVRQPLVRQTEDGQKCLLCFLSPAVILAQGRFWLDHLERPIGIAEVLDTNIAWISALPVAQLPVPIAQTQELKQRTAVNQASLDSWVSECVQVAL